MITSWDAAPPSFAKTERICRDLAAAYPFVSCRPLARSILGREIPMLFLGKGKKKILYVGAHHGAEGLTASLLLRFVEELSAAATAGASVYGIGIPYILETRMLCFVPMLNPDGVAIAGGEVEKDDLLAERRLRMNPSGDFTKWQANARGVDLNHNYDAGFAAYKKLEAEAGIRGGAPTRYSGEYPESEPETAALSGFIRSVSPAMIFSLHTQGEEIYCGAGAPPFAEGIARRMASLCGYRYTKPEGMAAYGGLSDFAAGSLGIPSFTLECGKGENPLPPKDAPCIYAGLRRLFFESTAF